MCYDFDFLMILILCFIFDDLNSNEYTVSMIVKYLNSQIKLFFTIVDKKVC